MMKTTQNIHLAFNEREKRCIIVSASFAALISPLSATIYYPILSTLAEEMHVSETMINLTITMYLVFQGLSPSVIGAFSDTHGRRPAYVICFTIFIASKIGLALQSNYAALMVLRCLQSSGSSGTIVLNSAIVADMATRAERGKYMGYAAIGATMGPAIGPIAGGLTDLHLSWRWIFWILAIFAGVAIMLTVLFLPETCRMVVGNGSVAPERWNLSAWQVIRKGPGQVEDSKRDEHADIRQKKRNANPFTSIRLSLERGSLFILISAGLLYGGYMVVLSTLGTESERRHGLNAIQVGLGYLPLGLGNMTSRWTVERMLDWRFRVNAQKDGLNICRNQQQDIANFNVEAACLIWVVSGVRAYSTGALVMLFFLAHLTTGAISALSTLLVDFHPLPAMAVSASNLYRCIMAAGGSAVSQPLVHRIGIGWTATAVAFVLFLFSPMLWMVLIWGHQWRKASASKIG